MWILSLHSFPSFLLMFFYFPAENCSGRLTGNPLSRCRNILSIIFYLSTSEFFSQFFLSCGKRPALANEIHEKISRFFFFLSPSPNHHPCQNHAGGYPSKSGQKSPSYSIPGLVYLSRDKVYRYCIKNSFRTGHHNRGDQSHS